VHENIPARPGSDDILRLGDEKEPERDPCRCGSTPLCGYIKLRSESARDAALVEGDSEDSLACAKPPRRIRGGACVRSGNYEHVRGYILRNGWQRARPGLTCRRVSTTSTNSGCECRAVENK